MDNNSIIEAWARTLLRQNGFTVKDDEPIEFGFIPDDCVGSLSIMTKTKYRRQQAWADVEDETLMAALGQLVEIARQA